MTGAEEQAIVDVVDDFIRAGAMFTAFDVTKEVRAKGNNVVHMKSKSVVHNFQFPSSYSRTIIPVSGVPVNPWLYHPKGADIASYKPGKVDASSISIQVKKTPATLTPDVVKDTALATQPVGPKSTGTGLFSSTLARLGFVKNPTSALLNKPTFKSASGFLVNLDARGRYCMRASVLSAAGLFPGDQVFMFINSVGKEILLIKTDATSLPKAPKITTLTVDKDSNLQIFTKYILKAFGDIPTKFDFTTDKNSITIKCG